jgi:D-alanyl-D-alanine carboxypeptidase
VISTLDDLHTWGVALGTGVGILSPQTQQFRVESVNQTVPANTPDRSYGMGIVNTAGWLGHTGEIPGYNTVLNYHPESGTTIAVMVNSDIPGGSKNQPVAPAVQAFTQLVQVIDAQN